MESAELRLESTTSSAKAASSNSFIALTLTPVINLLPASLLPVINYRHGVVYTGKQHIAGVVDTGDKLSPVLFTTVNSI
jgi:hypothetical protein